MKLENEWRNVKDLIIDEMSMVGLSLLARLNRIVKAAKHNNADTAFAGVNAVFFLVIICNTLQYWINCFITVG